MIQHLRGSLSFLALTSLLAQGCAMEEGEPPGLESIELNGGQRTWWRPDVVRLDFSNGSGCSGTLVAHNVILTAAHCLGWQDWPYTSPDLPYGHAVFSQLIGDVPVASSIPIVRGVIFGTDLDNDLALLLLQYSKDALPELQGVAPAFLAASDAPIGDRVYMFGYGCNRFDPGAAGQRQVVSWTYDGAQTFIACPGDSGGAVFGDAVGLFGVITGQCSIDPNDGQWTCLDIWADVPGRRAELQWWIDRWAVWEPI